jgi:hypothetical protein
MFPINSKDKHRSVFDIKSNAFNVDIKSRKESSKVAQELQNWMGSTSTHGIGPMARSLKDNLLLFFIWLVIWAVSGSYCCFSNFNPFLCNNFE